MTNRNGEKVEPLDLDSLQRGNVPPPELEERVVSELRKRRLLRSGFRSMPSTWLAAVLAACLVFFVAGVLYQKFFVQAGLRPATTVSMSDSTFVLFLLEGSDYLHPMNDQQQQERISAYRNWAVELRRGGIPVTGTKLRDEKNILGNVTIGNRQEEISGYFLIDANDPDEAVAIARKCPHLRYGGTIEIRRVHPV